MSTSSRERALLFPVVWGTHRGVRSTPADGLGTPHSSDEEAMVRVQAGDAVALHVLFDRYSRLVLRISFRILHDYGEAEEIVQDAFFCVYRKASLFDPSKGTAKSWIVQIAFRQALDRRAFLKRRGFYLGANIGALDDILLGETDLDREIGAKVSRVQLEKAFEELPEMQRRTIELFYFEGLELREISEKLNETLENVRHYYYRGLAKLRKSTLVQRLKGK